MRLTDKVVIVTGAARGIGAAIAKAFVNEGAKVSVADVLEREGSQLSQELQELGGQSIFCRLDVADAVSWGRTVTSTINRFGQLNVLVNNAGVGTRDGLEEEDSMTWARTMGVNAKGAYLGTVHCAPLIEQYGGGSIINISSISAMVGGHTSVSYHASKGALRSLTKSMSLRYARHGVRVNSIHPGDVITPLNAIHLSNPARLAQALSRVPLGRLGTPGDVAHLAVYLASDEASYVTGSETIIDGGRTSI